MTFTDGTVESGTWRSGRLHGPACVRERADGSRYEGPMVNGVEHGKMARLVSPSQPGANVGEQVIATRRAALSVAAAEKQEQQDQGQEPQDPQVQNSQQQQQAKQPDANEPQTETQTDTQTETQAETQARGAAPSSPPPSAASSATVPAAATSPPPAAGPAFNVYTGPFADGEMTGDNATLEIGATGGKYVGSVRGGRPHGQGTFVFNTRGAWAKGEWRDGRLHGPARHVREDGSSFVGDFQHGKRLRGTLTLPQGRGTVAGDFERGSLASGTITNARGDTFSGSFDPEQRLHGRGTVVYTNGLEYTGTFAHGEIEGHGVLKMADGCIYKGDMLKNRPHGWGTLTRADGSIVKGEWFEGRAKAKPGASPEPSPEQPTK
jgi:hypothetical protein